MIDAEIAFVRLSLDTEHHCHASESAFDRRGHHLHRTKRAGDDTGLAAETTLLLDLDRIQPVDDRAARAGIDARGVVAVVASHRRADVQAFDHPEAWRERRRRQQADASGPFVSQHAGDFASTAADTPARLRNNEPIHPRILHA